MKIAVWHNLPSGGAKRQLYEHVRGLVARDHYVECWCPESADDSFLPLSDLVTVYRVPLARRYDARARTGIAAAVHNARTLKHDLKTMESHCRLCLDGMVESRTDVVFANLTYGFHTGPIGRLSEMPSVLYLNEPFRWLYEAQPDWPWNAIPPSRCRVWTPSYLRWFIEDAIEVQTKRVKAREESRNARAYDRILVNSLFTRETVLRTYGCDARVCYLGVDADVFKPTPGPRDNLVVGVGVVRPRKRVHRAIEAVATVPAARRPALVWIGNAVDERYARRLHALAEDLSVAFKIRSRITDAELSATLARAKAMIYAPRLEPFGLAPLEANACETPVVAVAEGGVRETIRHGVNGLVVQDDTPRMLGDALDGLLSNPQRLAKMGRQGRELVLREWSWSTAIDRLEGQLMDVCGA